MMKKTKNKHLFFISAFLFFGFYHSSDSFISKLKGQLDKFNQQFPQEKIYVHTDRTTFIAGEDVWLKVYLRDAISMLATEISTVAYVELINQKKEIISTKNIFIENGTGAGDFELPINLSSGDYTLRAYTNFMRNFEESFFYKKNINIIGKEAQSNQNLNFENVNELAADFFPEGGDLVDGIASRVGFKIIDKMSGNGIPASGKILDENESTVAYFKTTKFGLGVFNFTPQFGQQYIAEIEFKSRIYKFLLPQVLSKGFVMQVSNRDVDNISIQLSTNIKDGIKGLYLVGQMRGTMFYAGKLDSESTTAKTTISKDSLPDGIAHLTIFSGVGEPLCERLVFVERTENERVVNVKTAKREYSPREKVTLDVVVKDFQKQSVQSNLSIAVTNSEFSNSESFSENIKSWMLLNSDLKGKIEQPGFYFSNEKKSTKYLLDILMMTQGWRRFTWKQLTENDFPEIKHLPEIGFNIKGYVTKQDSDKRRRSNVFLSVMGQQFQFEEEETDALGNFFFPNLHFFDSTAIVLQARQPFDNHERQKKKKKNKGKLLGYKLLDIHLQKKKEPTITDLAKSSNNVFTESQLSQYISQYERIEYEKEIFDGWDIELSDVVVKAKRKRKDMTPLELLDNSVKDLNRRYIIDSLVYVPKSVLEVLRDNPSVQITGIPFQESVNLPIILDDVRVHKDNMFIVHALSTENVYSIDVYDHMTNYHSNGLPAPGIVIYTKAYVGKGDIKRNGIVNIDHPGYYKAREFYSPNYDDKKQNTKQPDYRTTLYWNPKAITKENDNNEFSFFTGDEKGSYDVTIEGMTKRGIPVFGKYQIRVE